MLVLNPRAERRKYYKHGLKAKSNPKKCLSVTLDGMDQNKHNLPHLSTSTKVKLKSLKIELWFIFNESLQSLLLRFVKIDSSAWRLKMHVTGALVNHHSDGAAYVDMCEWPHDSNLTINILLHILLWMQTTVRFHGP